MLRLRIPLIAVSMWLFVAGPLALGTGSFFLSHRSSIRRPISKGARAPGEIIVKLKDVKDGSANVEAGERLLVAQDRLRELSQQFGPAAAEPLFRRTPRDRIADIMDSHGLDRVFVLKFGPETDIDSVIARLEASELVEYAEPNYLVKLGEDNTGSLPDDPGFPEQWGLRNLGLAVAGFPATLDADIRALAAWSITSGSPEVIVAVSDTGVDINHPDLAPNIYTNTREIPDNGRDDDGNGFVDDVHGYNAADRNGDVSDVLGHGTGIAGIIAGITNNHIGISGLCQAKILPVRFFKRTGPNPGDVEGTVADAARSILYSIAAGASIINASWSTSLNPERVPAESAKALADAVRAADDAGVLLVCIAGNDGVSIDFNPIYPASYQLPNQIIVAASDFNDELWHLYGDPFAVKSSFGVRSVHLAAPGVLVYTTAAHGECPLCIKSEKPEDWYDHVDGTSASAAFVSGVAALIKSKYPDSNVILTRRRIVESVDVRERLRYYVSSGGRLNAEAALTIQLVTSQPVLTKVKYKAGGEKLLIFGEALQRGAVVIVGNKSYPTKVKGDSPVPLVAGVPPSALPVGTPVEVRLRNPDGGVSQPLELTR